MQETRVQSLGQEGPLEKGMAGQSSILDWRISWTEEPDSLQSMGSQRVGHNLVTKQQQQQQQHISGIILDTIIRFSLLSLNLLHLKVISVVCYHQ